jgi:CubicO group peptidase (beta-lactamase class C family)
MSKGMARDRLPGGAYVLVSNGRIVASRGFGVTDVSTRRRVNPDSTVFGLASTTKLFTSIAAARLAREGNVDLDGPIAAYLANTPLSDKLEGITISRLLTHTAGIDDPTIGSAARSAAGLLPLGSYVTRSVTEPWMKPGTVTSYSNAGVALAGHVLSVASDKPYADLIDSTVFAPFGMRSASVRQPLPAHIEARRAVPYSASGDKQSPVPRIFFNDAPASAGYATARDMALLMAALLAPATPQDSALAVSLFSRRFSNHSSVPGMTLGFRESTDGDGMFEHGGDWQDYSSSLWLDRSSGTGLFAVFSSGEGGRTAADLWSVVRPTLPSRPSRYTFRARSNAVGCTDLAGSYRDTRMSRHTLAKLGALTGDVREVAVKTVADGIRVRGLTYRNVGGGVFQSETGRTVAFRCEAGGRPTFLFFGAAPSASYRRVAAADSRAVQGALLLLAFVTTVGAAVADIRRRKETNGIRDTAPRIVRIVASIAAIAFFVAMVFLLVSTNPWDFQYGLTAAVSAVQSISPAIAILAALAVVTSVIAIVSARARAGVLDVVLSIPAVLLVLLMTQWNLVTH